MISPMPLGEFRRRISQLYRDLGRRPSTIQKIEQALRELEQAGAATTADITTELIARWRASACARRAPETVVGLLSNLRAAASYAIEEGLLARPPSWKRLRPRVAARGEGRHLPWSEVAALLKLLRDRAAAGEWRDRRLYALVGLVAYTGIRRDEALFLRVQDCDPAGGLVWLRDIPERPLKTAGSGLPVPMPPELAKILERWIPETRSPWMFPGVKTGRPWSNGGPNRRPIDALQAAGRDAKLSRRVTWHLLRHSWATHAESLWGLSDAQIQRVLRHTKSATSRGYRHADAANLAELGRRVTFDVPRLSA